MKNIKLLNKIAKVGTDVFCKDCYNVGENVDAPVAMMVRSADLHEMTFNPELLAIARAGAGVNNIPLDKCAEAGIVVFNTPGANANAVKELAICALILASRDIVGGIEWAKSLNGQEDVAKKVEKGKSAFAGVELKGKTLGVIGLGAVGGMVANAGAALGMNVIGYDPYISVDAAWSLSRSVTKALSYDEIYEKSDYISIHAPATDETRGMINTNTIAKMKDGVRIINIARADLVKADDIIAARESGKVAAYVVDFPTEETIGCDKIVNIPHLGASTEEAEDNCAVMAAKQLVAYLENGDIINAVTYPNNAMPRHPGTMRIVVLHKNIPNIIAPITAAISGASLNIESMQNKSRKEYADTLLDVSGTIPDSVIDTIKDIDGVICVMLFA